MAVHNEEDWLKISLPYLAQCPLNKLVVVFDRCTDNSEKVFTELYKKPAILSQKTWANWHYQMAEAKAYGMNYAVKDGADYVLVADADLLIDKCEVTNAKTILDINPDVDAVCFAYRQHSITGKLSDRLRDEIANLLGIVIRHLGVKYRGGTYMVRAKHAHITDFQSDYETVLEGLNTKVLNAGTHLRPRYDKESQFSRGLSRARIKRYGFLRVALASALELSPHMLKGYLREGGDD